MQGTGHNIVQETQDKRHNKVQDKKIQETQGTRQHTGHKKTEQGTTGNKIQDTRSKQTCPSVHASIHLMTANNS